jgi:hypothetical protein
MTHLYFIPALAALAGSAVGGLASLAATWLTVKAQDRTHRIGQAISRKENLYGQFIDEASKVLSDALVHPLEHASNLVRLYSVLSKLRLFASASVVSKADEVMERILERYQDPDKDFLLALAKQHDLDILRPFSEACRKDLIL